MRSTLSILPLLLLAGSTALAQIQLPRLQLDPPRSIGPMCLGVPIGPREYTVVEDFDNDGSIDHAVRALSDGRIVWAIDSVTADGMRYMLSDTHDSVIGTIPTKGAEQIISATKWNGAFYTWTVTVRDKLSGHVRGIYGRSGSNQLFCISYDGKEREGEEAGRREIEPVRPHREKTIIRPMRRSRITTLLPKEGENTVAPREPSAPQPAITPDAEINLK